MRRSLAALALLLLASSACGGPPFIDLPNPIQGQITEVGIDTFVVTTTDGQRHGFINANPDDPGMGQAHLRVHLADRVPVMVDWRRDGYDLVAVRVTDASAPTSSPPASSPVTPGVPQPFPTAPYGLPSR